MDKLFNLFSGWISRSGDTTGWSWIITVIYAVTIIVSFYYIKRLGTGEKDGKRFLWICIAVFLVVLGINKQLDFQILITMAGKSVFRHQGWLEHRRTVQAWFAAGLFVCIVPAGCLLLFKTRKILRQCIPELSGVAILALFAFIRTGSISHIDAAADIEKHAISRIHGLELLGLAVILFALLQKLRKRPRTPARRGRMVS